MTDILNYTKSEEIFSAAQQLMPGGVSSPVRAFKSVGGQPIVFDRVKGPFAWDIDGNRYIDYIGSWGPAISIWLTKFLLISNLGHDKIFLKTSFS